MIEIKAPEKKRILGTSIFLAGSIEMGEAENWQDEVVRRLKNFPVAVYNPRRDDWDDTWVQSIDNEQFVEQVQWEQHYIQKCNWVFFYFDPTTKSPITLLELGQVLQDSDKYVIVVCPKGYWRKGNVDIVCMNANIKVFETLAEGFGELVKCL